MKAAKRAVLCLSGTIALTSFLLFAINAYHANQADSENAAPAGSQEAGFSAGNGALQPDISSGERHLVYQPQQSASPDGTAAYGQNAGAQAEYASGSDNSGKENPASLDSSANQADSQYRSADDKTSGPENSGNAAASSLEDGRNTSQDGSANRSGGQNDSDAGGSGSGNSNKTDSAGNASGKDSKTDSDNNVSGKDGKSDSASNTSGKNGKSDSGNADSGKDSKSDSDNNVSGKDGKPDSAGNASGKGSKTDSAGNASDKDSKDSSSTSGKKKDDSGKKKNSGKDNTFHTVTEDYFSDALFIGDSRTVGMQQSGLLPNATFYAKTGIGIGELLSQCIVNEGGYLISVENALHRHSFGKVYIMIGINDMSMGDTDWFRQQYEEIIQAVRQTQPDAIIYIQGNIPMSYGIQDFDGSLNNRNLRLRDEASRELADSETIFYLDVDTLYADKNGHLASMYTADGLHIKRNYYPLWVDYLEHRAIIH